MPEFIPVLTKDEIARLVRDLAGKISREYKGRDLVLIGVLNGAFVFLSDLIRELSIPVTIDFVRVSSYGSGTTSSGTITLSKDIDVDVKGKDVLLVEDIVDTGLTLAYLIDYMRSFGPNSVKVCTLLDKHERREQHVSVDYACWKIDEGFLVGYGLDYDEKYRELPGIYHLKF